MKTGEFDNKTLKQLDDGMRLALALWFQMLDIHHLAFRSITSEAFDLLHFRQQLTKGTIFVTIIIVLDTKHSGLIIGGANDFLEVAQLAYGYNF